MSILQNVLFGKTSGGAFSATGGEVSTVGSYTLHTFTSSADFTVTGTGQVDIFLVGRGGNGANASAAYHGRGGNGGEVITTSSISLSSNAYGVRVGGSGDLYGTTEIFSGFYQDVSTLLFQARGGGNGTVSTNANGAPGGTGAYDQNSGGSGYPSNGNGGSGESNNWTGATIYYGGGGGGGGYVSGFSNSGGTGGGGRGANTAATAYTADAGQTNTGGGGGGGARQGSPYTGKQGGSGIVIIRYLTP